MAATKDGTCPAFPFVSFPGAKLQLAAPCTVAPLQPVHVLLTIPDRGVHCCSLSMQVDGSGVAAVAYTDPAGNGMRFVRATSAAGTSWGSPVSVSTRREMRYNCLKIVDGVPVISYYDVAAKALYISRAKDGAWGEYFH